MNNNPEYNFMFIYYYIAVENFGIDILPELEII